jgi:hypothetical protein
MAQLISGRQFTSMIEGTAHRSGNDIPTGIEVCLLTGRSAPPPLARRPDDLGVDFKRFVGRGAPARHSE